MPKSPSWGQRQGKPFVGVLPILDPSFDQLRFRRGLHLLAFSKLAHLHATGQAPAEPGRDPRDARYDAVRRYIREPKHREAWPFLERYVPPAVVGDVSADLSSWNGGIIGKIRAYSLEFYVDLMNSVDLLAFAEAQGIDRVRLIEPEARYPASPTMEEVPPDRRWWLRIHNGQVSIVDPKCGEGFLFTPVGEPTYT